MPCVRKNLALFQLTPDRCDPTSLGAPMPATTGPSHGRQSLSQLLAVRSNARNGANALQWAIPAEICGRKGLRGGRLTGFQGVYGANSTLAQRSLRQPVCAGTAVAAVVAIFVNRGWPVADYENRLETSSGGQRFWLDSVAVQRRFSFWRLALGRWRPASPFVNGKFITGRLSVFNVPEVSRAFVLGADHFLVALDAVKCLLSGRCLFRGQPCLRYF